MKTLQRKWTRLLSVLFVAVLAVGAAACQGCSAKIRAAVDEHGPVVVDQAGIVDRYVKECEAGYVGECAEKKPASCQKAKDANDKVKAAGAALVKKTKDE